MRYRDLIPTKGEIIVGTVLGLLSLFILSILGCVPCYWSF